jgi:hypothetical protein
VLAKLRKPSGNNAYTPLQALINSGAVFNFISQDFAQCLGLKLTDKLAPPMSSIDGHALRTYGIYRQTVHLGDDSGREQCVTLNLVAADILGYDLILGMAWLLRYNPDIMWRKRKWLWRVPSGNEADNVLLQDLPAFYTCMQAKGARLYAVTMCNLRVPAVGLAATVLGEPSIPPEFKDLSSVFSEDEARNLADHGPQDLAIDLQEGKQPLSGPIYNLSKK